MKMTIACLILLIGILSCVLYLQDRKIEVYQAHNEMQQRAIHKLDSILSVQDSIVTPIKSK